MEEGTVPSTLTTPPRSAMMTYTCPGGIAFGGGAEAAGVKPPRAFRFFEYFSRAGRIPFF